MARIGVSVTIVTLASLLAGGCQVAQYCELGPQSHFDYPNRNVTAIAPVRAMVNGHSGMGLALPTAEDHAKVYQAALQQVAGATLITDYAKTVKIYQLPFVPWSWNTLEIEGTAAKMTIGKQELR